MRQGCERIRRHPCGHCRRLPGREPRRRHPCECDPARYSRAKRVFRQPPSRSHTGVARCRYCAACCGLGRYFRTTRDRLLFRRAAILRFRATRTGPAERGRCNIGFEFGKRHFRLAQCARCARQWGPSSPGSRTLVTICTVPLPFMTSAVWTEALFPISSLT